MTFLQTFMDILLLWLGRRSRPSFLHLSTSSTGPTREGKSIKVKVSIAFALHLHRLDLCICMVIWVISGDLAGLDPDLTAEDRRRRRSRGFQYLTHLGK